MALPSPAAQPTKAPQRRRRWPWLLGGVLVVLAGGAWWLARMLEPERLSAFLLQQASAATGLQLALGAPAGVSFWPDLHIELQGLRATAPGAARPLLEAGRVDLVLPWGALLHREIVIEHLRLLRPQLDLDAFLAWRAATAVEGPPAPFELPELTASLSIEDGTLAGNGWRLEDVAIETSGLRDGQRFHADVEAALVREGAPMLLAFSVQTVPRMRDGALSLDPLGLTVRVPGADDGVDDPLDLEGSALLDPPRRLQLQLAGSMTRWPSAWPALETGDAGAPVALGISYDGPADGTGQASLDLARGEASVQAQALVVALADWIGAPMGSPLPPMTGSLDAPRIELDGVQLIGVRATLRPDDAPADAGGGSAR